MVWVTVLSLITWVNVFVFENVVFLAVCAHLSWVSLTSVPGP